MNLFVPGRVCLFGEHSDWAGGYRRQNPALEKGATLLCGTEQGIYAEVQPHPSALILRATTPEGRIIGPRELPMDPAVLLEEARAGGFWSYIAGVAYHALRWGEASGRAVGGLVLHNTRTDLPIRKGLSSSAAICVLTARAFNRLYGLGLDVHGEMELAYLGETTTPSRCGRMDQGCAYGRVPIHMEFDGDEVSISPLPVGGDVHLVLVDLCAGKDTQRILADLNRCYPFARNKVAQGVQALLGPVNRRITTAAAEALAAGDEARLGALMTEAQELFDRYAMPACPEELASPVLHRVLAYGPLQRHVWGGKGVGSQGDGMAQFVARGAAGQTVAMELLAGELGFPSLALTIRAGDRSQGTGYTSQEARGADGAI